MKRPPSLWLVVLNYNGLEDTQKCLASLRAVGHRELSILVVDNASSQDPIPALRTEFPEAHYLRNPVNGGYAGGNNTGIVFALDHGADLVVLLNNDTIVTPDFAHRLAEAAVSHPNFGILGPVINFMEEPDQVMTDGCVFNTANAAGFFQRKVVPLKRLETPAVAEVDIVNGCCMMVRAEVFRRIGLIDERFFLVHEESDFCLRARQAGFRCGVVGETLVRHKGSSSFKRSGKRLQRYYDARNLYLLLRKHQATHRSGRGVWRSRLEYLKYVYYRYAIEKEEGHHDAAEAVLQGVCDALSGRYGPFPRFAHPALPWIRKLFGFWHSRRSVAAARKEKMIGALPVR
ncbi:MAG: glycosyltransferase family 2 protein [Gemmataceae bacterium]